MSKKGGYPDVNETFIWPSYNGKHLSFIAQIETKYIFGDDATGVLLFFWNESNWGGSFKDRGSFKVIHQDGTLQRISETPSFECKMLGLFQKTYRPTVWKEEALNFRASYSVPPIARLDYDWSNDLGDLYVTEVEKLSGFSRIGGYPNPIQEDDMEEGCIKIKEKGTKESWYLPLEIDSQGDMMWGDAGRLYWFLEESDYQSRSVSEVWMQMQCH